jgi:hypothetical protein
MPTAFLIPAAVLAFFFLDLLLAQFVGRFIAVGNRSNDKHVGGV